MDADHRKRDVRDPEKISTSAGRKNMTTPKVELAGLAVIAVLCAGFTLGLTAPTWAGFDEGMAAYQRGDYATALREWHPLAEQGNARTQRALGFMYDNGRGVFQDYAEAMKWYRKAAERGDAKAQFNLGNMYDNGRGVPQDYAEALQWYRKAAEQGDAKAQNNLGFMYDKGQGAPQDYAEAVKWYRKAAKQGVADAQFNLGIMYAGGKGVTKDYVRAHMWINLSTVNFSGAEFQEAQIVALKFGLSLSLRMSKEQKAESRKLASECIYRDYKNCD